MWQHLLLSVGRQRVSRITAPSPSWTALSSTWSSFRSSYSTESVSAAATASRNEVLSRTSVITDVSSCAAAVDKIMAQGPKPIAVDMEGVTLPRLGLIQVRVASGEIFIFRTGRNPELLTAGGLGDMLRDPDLIKVMHGSQTDAIAVYKEGIRMWGLFDTGMAHKVLSYQALGTPLLGSTNQISFQKVCAAYGVAQNPLKQWMEGSPWQRHSLLLDAEELSEDMIYYSACDVEPLLDLYDIMTSQMEEDFVPLFRDMSDNILVRCIDEENFTAKQKLRSRFESADVFLSGLGDAVTKADIYALICRCASPKKVLFSKSNHSAHIILNSREAAMLLYKGLGVSGNKADRKGDEILTVLPEEFGPDVQCKLVVEPKADEIYKAAIDYEKHIDRLKKENYIVDCKQSAALVDSLIKARCPVVLDFHLHPSHVAMELFTGKYPAAKFNLTRESVTDGKLGHLLASPDVVKVVARVDLENVHAALRLSADVGLRPCGFFELVTAFKIFDFWHHGQSIYQTTSVSVRDLMAKFGLRMDVKLENFLHIYLHLREVLPAEFLEFLSAKAQVDADVGAQLNLSEAKEARRQLRLHFETNSLHIECERGPPSRLRQTLEKYIHSRGLEHKRMIVVGRYAIVEMAYHGDIFAVTRDLRSTLVDGLVLTATDIDLKAALDRKPIKTVDMAHTRKIIDAYLEELENAGFFQALAQTQNSSIEAGEDGRKISREAKDKPNVSLARMFSELKD